MFMPPTASSEEGHDVTWFLYWQWKFDHLVEEMSLRSPHCKDTFSYVKLMLIYDPWDWVNILFVSENLFPRGFTMRLSSLPEATFKLVLRNSDFFHFIISSTWIGWQSAVILSFFPLSLFCYWISLWAEDFLFSFNVL